MRFVFRPNHPEANENGMVPIEKAPPKGVEIIRDIEPYLSPIDGRPIMSRRERKEDLKRSGCVEWEPTFPGKPQGLINERFVKKHGLQHMMTPEARERYYEKNGK
jgi:hypothetical protein